MSAGDTINPQQNGASMGGQTGAGYGGATGPSFQPMGMPAYNSGVSSPSIAIKANMSEEQTEKYMWGQFGMQVAGAANGLVNMLLNFSLAGKAMSAQLELGNRYYEAQEHIADNQTSIAMRQLQSQDTAVDAQKQMLTSQQSHERQIARIEGSTQARLAQIQQSGMTARAKVLITGDAFRRGWNMGDPAIAA